jgi:ribokinase
LQDCTPQVIGLGQCSLDILGQLDQYPALDQKAELSSLIVQGGGPVATALVTLARLDIPVSFIGAVGDDEYGEQIETGLLEEGVDCRFLRTEVGTNSQVAFISVDGEGHRNIFWHRGNAIPTLPQNFSDLMMDGVEVLHLDGLHQEVALSAAKVARECNVTTVLDAGTLRPGIERLLPLIDHLVVAEEFACQYIERKEPEAALHELARLGGEAATVTLGEQGSITLDNGGKLIRQPAFDVQAVDTTGCGDVFHGGYIYGLLNGWPLIRTLCFASACAALKTRSLGGRTAIPRLSEVEDFLQNNNAMMSSC